MSTPRSIFFWLLALLPLGTIALGGWSRRWVGDDGMINIRTVQMLLDGWGPVFNVGERVESFTSALWVYWIAGWGGLGLLPEEVAVISGLAMTLCGVVMAQCAALKLHDIPLNKALPACIPLPLGALAYTALPVAWDYATAGLETGMSVAWLGGAYLGLVWLVRGHERRARFHLAKHLAVAFLLGLGPLVRPELALFSGGGLLIQAIWWLGKPGVCWKKRLGHLAALVCVAGCVPVGYEVFRMGYYGAIVPNTAVAKSAFDSRWDQGLRFFDNFFGRYHLLLPLGLSWALATPWWREDVRQKKWTSSALWALPLACGILNCVYVVKVGGGFMHGRLFLPGVFCLLMPVAMIPLGHLPGQEPSPSSLRSVGFGTLCVTLIWFVLCVAYWRVEQENEFGIGDERGWYARIAKQPNPIRAMDYAQTEFVQDALALKTLAISSACGNDQEALNKRTCSAPFVLFDDPHLGGIGGLTPPQHLSPIHPSAVTDGDALLVHRVAIGIRGVLLGPGVHIVDAVGLADPVAARFILLGRGRPGHEKIQQNLWFIARTAAPSPHDSPQLKLAREVLDCPGPRALYGAVYDPLTWDRFWQNVALASRLHRLRIHPDPVQAKADLCGERAQQW